MKINLNAPKFWIPVAAWIITLAAWVLFAIKMKNDPLVLAIGAMIALAPIAMLYFFWIDKKIKEGKLDGGLNYNQNFKQANASDEINGFLPLDVNTPAPGGNILGRIVYNQMHPKRECEPPRSSHPNWITKLP